MAAYTVAAGQVGAYAKTFTASTADTVTFAYQATAVEVINHSSTAGEHIYVRLDGTTPVAAAAATIIVPPGTVRVIPVRQADPDAGNTVVGLIAAGSSTPSYSVAKAV